MFQKLGGRKAVMSLIVILIGILLVFTKGDVPPNLLTLLQFVVGVFVGGNVASSISQGISVRKTVAPPAQKNEEVEMALNGLTSTVNSIQSGLGEVSKATQLNQQALAFIVSKIGPQQ